MKLLLLLIFFFGVDELLGKKIFVLGGCNVVSFDCLGWIYAFIHFTAPDVVWLSLSLCDWFIYFGEFFLTVIKNF